VARCTPAQFITGPHRANDKEQIPAAEVYLRPLERLAIFEADAVPRLTLRPRRGPERQLAVHPGSGSEKKNWPEEKWALLLEQLVHSSSHNLLLVGGEAEGERLQRLSAALPPLRTRVAQSLPLPELAGLLQTSCGFVGHDSGISHLAAAVGLPGVVLWGETAEAVWRPPSKKVMLLREPEGLAELPVRKVLEAIESVIQREAV